jgi:hypothetical protein
MICANLPHQGRNVHLSFDPIEAQSHLPHASAQVFLLRLPTGKTWQSQGSCGLAAILQVVILAMRTDA